MNGQRREIEKYRRAGIREQVAGTWNDFMGRPGLVALALVILGGFLVLRIVLPVTVTLADLESGDCLYVPVPSQDLAGGPAIGIDSEIRAQLLSTGAERASCTMSHGHEVAGVLRVVGEPLAPFPGTAALEGPAAGACLADATSYLGRDVAGSPYSILVVMPDEARWMEGLRTGVCLVHRTDGRFMDRPARAGG
jgi:hypothetical protein